jgi:glyoxylate reductase
MRKPTIFVSRRLPGRVREELDRLFEPDVHDSERQPSRDELLARVPGRQGLVTMLTDVVDGELLDAAGPELRVVANYAVGYDNVDVEAATGRGVVVANTPDVLVEATAELTIGLALDLLRRISEGDRLLRRGESWVWAPTFMLGRGLRGLVLGIVGLGRIGSEVARLAESVGMRVVYTNRSGPVEAPFEWLPLGELLRHADVVSLHVPLTAETRHLIGREELETMRREAILVNTARGPVVDEEALAEALRAGEIAGAALDVFEQEPYVSEALLELENVVLTPHLGSATSQARDAMGMLCVDALRAVLLEHRCPGNAVNPEAWLR